MTNSVYQVENANTRSLLRQAFDVSARTAADWNILPEAAYFMDLTKAYFDPDTPAKPQVILFGTDFPLEIIHALTGRLPYCCLGGNPAFLPASDEDVPRDTDPVTRSILGQLFSMEQAKETALVIVPCSSDAQRKAAYLLQSRGWKVVTIWIPALKNEFTHRGFVSELDHAIRTICRHVGRRYNVFALNRSAARLNEVRSTIHAFLDAARGAETIFPGYLRMAVLDSFFMASDLDDWHSHLQSLTAALTGAAPFSGPRVLLIGSPVYYPNFKIPMLLRSAGVEICGSIDSRTGQYEDVFAHKPEKGMEALAHYYFEHDSSSAFVWNEELMAAIRHYVAETKPDGIIWHVLKGQIEYDFELNRCESYFEEMDLPVIRLETDYQEQDVEQLRIRIEAFSELLTQKRKERTA